MIIERLSSQTGRPVPSLFSFALTASKRYRVFSIPKKSGGERVIEQPSKAVKALQRWLIASLFSQFQVHTSATAYRAGSSIGENAACHKHYPYSVRIDFKDFFWSFTSDSISLFLRSEPLLRENLTDVDIIFITAIVTRNGRLVMGAPSSPIITNIMMFELDGIIEGIAKKFDGVYTRYADDIIISTNMHNASEVIVQEVSNVVAAYSKINLMINEKKTIYMSKKVRREITGLIVTTDGKISLGRHRKRMISSQIHKAMLGNLSAEDMGSLRGLLNWAASIEPELIKRLAKKYGHLNVARLRKN